MEAGTAQLLQILQDVEEQINELEEKREKITAQLQSLQNLSRQLIALESCSSSNSLGILSHMTVVVQRLEGKLLVSMERALSFIERDKKLMSKTVKHLLQKRKRAQKIFEEVAESQGVEVALERTAERFSTRDWVSWVVDLSCLIYANWEEKRNALDGIKVFEEGNITSVYDIWERDIVGSTEILELITFTLQQNSSDK